jgi:hypothetical protein
MAHALHNSQAGTNMKSEQRSWRRAGGWLPASCGPVAQSAQLVLVFGATATLQDRQLMESMRESYPAAHILRWPDETFA